MTPAVGPLHYVSLMARVLFRRASAATLVLWLSIVGAAHPQQANTDSTAIKRLAFLAGRWSCTVNGGSSNGLTLDVRYSFSPNWLWMTEESQDSGAAGTDWATQLWGYDARTKKLVAFQFTQSGVFTKSLDGWVNGIFVSHRDENGATVSLKPLGANSFQWIIESSDHSYTVTQDCIRR
jgi:hypothetical protein